MLIDSEINQGKVTSSRHGSQKPYFFLQIITSQFQSQVLNPKISQDVE